MTTILSLSIFFTFLLLLCTVNSAIVIANKYNRVRNGDIVSGIALERRAASKNGCALRCSDDNKCTAYLFEEGKTCSVIHGHITDGSEEDFTADENNAIYKKNNCYPDPCLNNGLCVETEGRYSCSCVSGFGGSNCEELRPCDSSPCQNSGTCVQESDGYNCSCPENYIGDFCEQIDCIVEWIPPSDWPTEDTPVVYRNFDCAAGLQLIGEANVERGLVNNAVWAYEPNDRVELGNLSVACLTAPDTCGSEGGALSFWTKFDMDEGYVVTKPWEQSGIEFSGESSEFGWVELKLIAGLYVSGFDVDTLSWRHMVFNYIPPTIPGGTDGEFTGYYNGAESFHDTEITARSSTPGDGTVRVCDIISGFNDQFFCAVDELTFWNRALTVEEIQALYNYHSHLV